LKRLSHFLFTPARFSGRPKIIHIQISCSIFSFLQTILGTDATVKVRYKRAHTILYINITVVKSTKKLFSLVSVSLTNFYHTAKCQKYCSDFVVCEELTTGQQPEARFVYAYSVNCIKCICIWLIVLHTISLSNIHKSVYIYQYCYISNRLS